MLFRIETLKWRLFLKVNNYFDPLNQILINNFSLDCSWEVREEGNVSTVLDAQNTACTYK